jgi:uncharacterized RDD family membrane protein YckC
MATTAPRPAEFATLTTDDLVTGEGVALDLPPASLGLRIGSGLIDVTVTVLLFVVTLFVLLVAASLAQDEALFAATLVATNVIAFLVYPTLLETLTRGRSLGKLAFGLRAVRDDAGPVSFHHSLVRALIGYVEIYAFAGMPAFFSMLVNRRGKRLGDLAAGTYVVRDRVRLQLPMPPPMPPGLAHWASRADLASLPTGLALAVRQYVARLATLDPHTRQRVGGALLAEVRPYVAPAPPADAPPDLVLAAVIAARRDRDFARLRREDELRARLRAH